MAMMKISSLIVVFSIFYWNATLHASEQELYALVIGNSDYSNAQRLENASKDAHAIAEKLRALGFNVLERHDQSRSGMRETLREFHTRLQHANNPVALLFFAGHGLQRRGENFLIPIDADISKEYEIGDAALNLGTVLSSLGDTKPRLSIIMLDACRNNPYERRIRGVSRGLNFRGEGLAAVDSVQGMILSYATEPGNVAVDGSTGHSPYTAAILSHIDTPNLSIQDMLNQVGLSVISATHGEQKPWMSSSPIPRFCFTGCDTGLRLQRASPAAIEVLPGNTIIAAIQSAFQAQSMQGIKQHVRLTTEQEQQISKLFEIYPTITLQPTQVSRSLILSGKGKTLDMVVSEAINEEGNRVLPSPKWRYLTFDLL
jgi:hypothetical protein